MQLVFHKFWGFERTPVPQADHAPAMASAACSIRGPLKLAATCGTAGVYYSCNGYRTWVSYPVAQGWSSNCSSVATRHVASHCQLSVRASARWRSNLKASATDAGIVSGKLLCTSNWLSETKHTSAIVNENSRVG